MSDAPRRVALVLEYDGTRYGGSQRQKNAPTIQGELEAALGQLTNSEVSVALAGRTDAGVHALGQVAAFTTDSILETAVFVRGSNALLPTDIAVQQAIEVAEDFDPRRHATARLYRYTIYNSPARSPLHKFRTWHLPNELDIDTMRQAADALVGEHDFAAFSRREGVRTVRCIRRCHIGRHGSLVTVEIEANAFLRQQMRRTVGALVEVGTSRMDAGDFHKLLQEAEPATAGPAAPPQGLCLVRVAYPGLDLGP